MKILTTYLLLYTVLVSCDKLEEIKDPPLTSDLQGKWELQSVSCFCFFPDNFDFGAHTIEFNGTADEVVIENSNDTFFVTDSGTYDIVVESDRISIKDSFEYTFQIDRNTLTLSFIDNPKIADDEISLTYSKI